MEQVFVDTDVMLDLLGEREPFYVHAARLFSRADKGEISIFVSSLSFANVNYLLTRQYNASIARKLLLKFKTLVTVLPVSDKIIDLALSSNFADFEDAIQYFSAIEHEVSVLITRNLRDFRQAQIPVMTAEQYLSASPQ